MVLFGGLLPQTIRLFFFFLCRSFDRSSQWTYNDGAIAILNRPFLSGSEQDSHASTCPSLPPMQRMHTPAPMISADPSDAQPPGSDAGDAM